MASTVLSERRDVSRSRRGLDNCWWSDSSTLKAITVEPLGPNAQSALNATHMLSRNHLWAFIFVLVAKYWCIAVSVAYFSCLSKAQFALCSWVCNSGTEKNPHPHVLIYIGRLCPCEFKMLTSDSLDRRSKKLHVRLQLAKRPVSGCGLVAQHLGRAYHRQRAYTDPCYGSSLGHISAQNVSG